MDDTPDDNIVVYQSNMPLRIVAGLAVVLFLVVLAVFFMTPPPPEPFQTDVVYLNDETFGEQTASGVVLVDFYADWCGPCQMMGPALEEVATQFKEKAVVAKVNGDYSRQLVNKFRVAGYPTLVLLKDGQEISRVEGPQSEAELTLLLETALGQP